jgi:hypothetical protein
MYHDDLYSDKIEEMERFGGDTYTPPPLPLPRFHWNMVLDQNQDRESPINIKMRAYVIGYNLGLSVIKRICYDFDSYSTGVFVSSNPDAYNIHLNQDILAHSLCDVIIE